MATLRQVAQRLAQAHRKADPSTTTIKLIPDPKAQVIRLIEVSSTAPTTGEVLPFGFDATKDVPFPSIVILRSPEEFAKLQGAALVLPDGWDFVNAEDL
jgi:hypothetical protein